MGLRPLFAYGVALASVAIALVVRAAMPPATAAQLPLLTLFIATIVSAWVGGVGPGLLAVAATLVANGLFLEPVGTQRIAGYLVISGITIALFGWLRSARDRAERARRNELVAREAAERARERASFLSDGNVVLNESLDYDRTLRSLAGLLVPRLADWCAVDVVEDDGTVRRVAVSHADPAKADLARATAVYQPDPDGRHPRTEVIRTGRSQLFAEIDEDWLGAIAANRDHLRVMRQMGYVSAMIVAMVARGRTLGTITCATMESGRRYTGDDLALAENVAIRAALALDNARLYREAGTARAQAEEANRAKDQFLSVVSHELKTPLAATLGWLRVLRSGKGEHAERAIQAMQRSIQVQARLIDDLLDISRIATGRLHLDVRAVNLADTVAAAVDMVRPAADAKGVRLDVALSAVADEVHGDPDRIQQIVWNVLDNAVKFTEAGASVSVALAQVGPQVEIVVRDTGRGIAPDFLPHVFEAFRQADAVSARSSGGLGLGLAIARHLVHLHGGDIAVASEGENRGSTFTLTLPTRSAPASTAPVDGSFSSPDDGDRVASGRAGKEPVA
ncbi:MAG TPA: ATP-binding protein [Candidatus Binatia bacterium]|nr:ATP-binding protein [Candidatus Binatia bacterium]